ncbi:MAG: hypothetical protein MUO50_18230, partial [Longimicrobiales bacterium]|nr:hypothetical protein [Longimicrobiales bacterium]
GTRARAELLILLFLLVDGILVWERSWRMTDALSRGVPTHPRFLGRRGSTVFLRVLLGILLPAGALLRGWAELAAVFLFLNLFLDRFLFYGLAVRCTTEAEVERAEMALRTGTASRVDSIDSTLNPAQARER